MYIPHLKKRRRIFFFFAKCVVNVFIYFFVEKSPQEPLPSVYIQPYMIKSSLETSKGVKSLEFHGNKKSVKFHVVFRDRSFRDTLYKVSK